MHRALPLFAALSAVLLLPAGAAAGPAASGDGAAEVAAPAARPAMALKSHSSNPVASVAPASFVVAFLKS